MAAAAAEVGSGRAVQVIKMIMITVDSTSRKNGNRLADSVNGIRFQKQNRLNDNRITSLVTMERLTFAPQNYPISWTDPQTQLPASSLDPSDLPSQTASISDQPFCHYALDKQADIQKK